MTQGPSTLVKNSNVKAKQIHSLLASNFFYANRKPTKVQNMFFFKEKNWLLLRQERNNGQFSIVFWGDFVINVKNQAYVILT